MSAEMYESWDEEEEGAPPKGVADITAAEKYEFLQLIRQGYDRSEAAKALGYTARPWRSLTSTASLFYDEEFTNSYWEAKGSPEARMNYVERLRDRVRELAFMGEVRLLEKEALVHLPEWEVLRQKDINVNVRAVFEAQLKELPTELLQQVLAQLEAGETIDAEVIELPPASESDDGDTDRR